MTKYVYNVKPECYFSTEQIGTLPISTFSGYRTKYVDWSFPLIDILTTSFGCESVKKKCTALRAIDKEHNTDEYKNVKSSIMCATISCLCDTIRDDKHACVRHPLICLDFDAQDNFKLYDDNKRKSVIEGLYNWEYCYAVGVSCSGKGVFCLVPLCSNDDTHDFLGYFHSLREYFKNLGLVMDENCKDVTRLRTCSLEKPLVKSNCNIRCWQWQQWPVIENHVPKPTALVNPNATINDFSLSVELLNMLCNSPASFDTYNDWYKLGFILAPLGDTGYQIFDTLSAQSANYGGSAETAQKWQQTAPQSNKTITDTVRFAIAQAKQYLGNNAVRQAKVNILKRKQNSPK